MSKESSASGGIGFGGLLAAIFITLKLVGVIHWSWWWVLAPLWGPVAVFLAIMIVCLIGAVIIAALD